MGTQIFLMLCGLAMGFLTYCLIQFGREWWIIRASRAAAHSVPVRTAERPDQRRVIDITAWNQTSPQHGTRRMAS